MAVPSTGEYGVEEGLICSFPVTCGGGEYRVQEGLKLSEAGRHRFEKSVEELRQEKAAVESLGLLGN
ncbi:malate dehydrogenase, partial [Streptococcus danieliae]|nr:malate dehydrogenase [Streptococcus danieliae]